MPMSLRKLSPFIPRRARAGFASQLWQQMQMEVGEGDLRMAVRSRADLLCVDEVFVRGEYEPAVSDSFRAARDQYLALDLGANIGAFSLRVAIAAGHQGISLDRVRVFSVEGSPRNYATLKQNSERWSTVWSGHTARLGLVGKRTGSELIYERTAHTMATTKSTAEGAGTRVEYLDLDSIVPPEGDIDLIKCDIEGGEADFCASYPNLLKRCRRFVCELHHELCDTASCIRALNDAGLSEHRLLREDQSPLGRTTVEIFARA